MYKKIYKTILILFTLFFIQSCYDPSISSGILDSISDSTIDDSSSTEKKEYQKDENGFYILEDDYYSYEAIEDDKEVSKLRFSNNISKDYTYSQIKLFGNGVNIPVYNCKVNISQVWNALAPSRQNNAVAIVELKGEVEFKIQCNFAILDECVIRPLQANITPKIDEERRVITFKISSKGQYTIELRSKRVLHLFVNSYGEFDSYKNEENLIYFGPGVHNHQNNSRIDKNNKVNLSSNTTVYVDYGAIVQAAFFAHGGNNIKIVGGGIIDGSVFERNANINIQTIPYEFNYCSNLMFKGIVTTDPAGWCYNIYYCDTVVLDNIKIISSRSNGDGVSIQSCKNVTCKNSFVRSWDDSLVVKNYPEWSDRSRQGTTKNIVFDNCILWTDLAQSMEIGFETVGLVMEDITFNNITVLHNYHKAPISIHNGNNANIKRVKFTNITIEDAAMGKGDGNNLLIDIACEYSSTWSPKQGNTSLGSIDDVLLENIKVIECIDNAKVHIRGSVDPRSEYNNTTHYVSNITLKDIIMKDEILTEKYKNYETSYSKNINFITSGNSIIGSKIEYDDSLNYGKNYKIEIL